MTEQGHRVVAATVSGMTALCALAVGVVTVGTGAVPVFLLAASVVAVLAGWLGMRLLYGRSPRAAWTVVWLAGFGWWNAALFIGGGSHLLRAAWAGVLSTMGGLLLLAVAYLGPWSQPRAGLTAE